MLFWNFCIKFLCFSKNCIFHIFYQSNLLLDRSKMRLKFWFEPDHFDSCSIAFRSIECNFQSIKCNFWSIENRIESFLKTLSFHVFCHFWTFSKHFSLSLRLVKESKQFFVVFLRNFCKIFLFQGRSNLIALPFSFIFSFHVLIHALLGDFWTFANLGFLTI